MKCVGLVFVNKFSKLIFQMIISYFLIFIGYWKLCLSIKTNCLCSFFLSFLFQNEGFCFSAPVCRSPLLTAAGNWHISRLIHFHKPPIINTGCRVNTCLILSCEKNQPILPLFELYLKKKGELFTLQFVAIMTLYINREVSTVEHHEL